MDELFVADTAFFPLSSENHPISYSPLASVVVLCSY